jgi:hypothetical protein
MVLWSWLACASDPATCAAGFEAGADGLCYEVGSSPDDDTDDPAIDTAPPTGDDDDDEVTLDDVLAALWPCTARPGDGELDLGRGCAGTVCAGMTYDELVAELGDAEVCDALTFAFGGYSFSYVDCAWPNGLGGQFDDLDEDGLPDPDSTTFVLSVDPPYAGTTAEGYGLGSEMSCFLQEGDPDYVAFEEGFRDWEVSYLSFERFSVSDDSGDDYAFLPDGYADGLSLYE